MKYTKLTPNFSVKNVKETILFYQNILNFNLEMLVPNDKEVIEFDIIENKEYNYAMMKKDEVFLMFLDEKSFKKDIPIFSNNLNNTSILFYIDVENIDEMYNTVKDKVEVVKKLNSTWYGMKEFYIKDCNGYILGFGEKNL